jgi:hypothetical protein
MKKITLLTIFLLSFVANTKAQCNDDVPLPYLENFDTTILPDLPDCTYSYKQTFVGSDWEAVASPNSDFTGNVAQYNTYSDAGWGMWCSYILRPVQLTAGMAYKISYKYAHNDNETTIYALRTNIYSNNPQPEISIGNHEAITGTDVVNYSSELFTVPTTNSYYLRFDIESAGSEGILYLDDIKIEEMGVMGTTENTTLVLSCYPNPVKDILTITNTAALEKLELYSLAGQLLITQSVSSQTASLDLEHLPSGAYFLKAKSGLAVQTLQVIKQ